MLHTRPHHLGRNRQVEYAAAGNAELLVESVQLGLELGIGSAVVEAALNEKERPGKIVPV